MRSTGQLPPGMKPMSAMTDEDDAAARAKDLAAVKKRIRKR